MHFRKSKINYCLLIVCFASRSISNCVYLFFCENTDTFDSFFYFLFDFLIVCSIFAISSNG